MQFGVEGLRRVLLEQLYPMDLAEKMSQQVIASEKRALEKRTRAEEEEIPQWQEGLASPLSNEEGYDDHDVENGEEMAEPQEEDDEEEEDDLPQGTPFNPRIWPAKTPRGTQAEEEDEGPRGPRKSGWVPKGSPDLEKYFAQWPGLTDFTKVALCRTYANMAAQRMRAANPVAHGLVAASAARVQKRIRYGKE